MIPCEVTVTGGFFFGLCIGFILTTLYDKAQVKWAKYWQRWHEKEAVKLERELKRLAEKLKERE